MSRDLNVKHLEYFLKVAQLGSINKAAQALLSPSPIWGRSFTIWRTALGTCC